MCWGWPQVIYIQGPPRLHLTVLGRSCSASDKTRAGHEQGNCLHPGLCLFISFFPYISKPQLNCIQWFQWRLLILIPKHPFCSIGLLFPLSTSSFYIPQCWGVRQSSFFPHWSNSCLQRVEELRSRRWWRGGLPPSLFLADSILESLVIAIAHSPKWMSASLTVLWENWGV